MKILVTGGASGLGEAVTKSLATHCGDWRVFFTYKKSIANAKQICDEFKNTKSIYCDFCNTQDVVNLQNMMEQLDIDVLINNAIVYRIEKQFHKIPSENLKDSFIYNVIPTIEITQKAIEIFKKKHFGKIISILTSGLLNRPPFGWSEYIANKAYIESMAKSWACEYSKFNITSNCVSPDFMQTNLTASIDERIQEQIKDSNPLKKHLSIEETARIVLFVVMSPQQLNGVNIPINAGKNLV